MSSGCQGISHGETETEHLDRSMEEIAIVTRPDTGLLPAKAYHYHGDGTDSLASADSPADQACTHR